MPTVLWIVNHSNYCSGVVRAAFGAVVALNWSHLTPAQIGAIMVLVEVVLNPFVEKNTVSKVRMEERMVEQEAKVDAKAEAKANEKVVAMMTPQV